MTNKVALITGITGMVGSHLLDYLYSNTDWDIHGIYRWRSPLNNIQHHMHVINSGGRIKLHLGDITDIASLHPILSSVKPDYVFHLAAQSYPKTSFTSAQDTFATNIQGTENVLSAVREHSPEAVVHVCSSSEVFGRVPKEFVPINEDCRFHPASPYAISKCGTDLIGRYYAEAYGINTQITRMFTHTGPRRGDVFMESSFAKQIALIEKNYLPPVVKVGNLDSLRTIADVRDAVDAYYKIVTTDPVPGEYYNIGGSTSLTVKQVLEYLISISSRADITYEVDPGRLRPIDADLQVPDLTKFLGKVDWKPAFDAYQTLSDLMEYWRQQVHSYGNSFLQR